MISNNDEETFLDSSGIAVLVQLYIKFQSTHFFATFVIFDNKSEMHIKSGVYLNNAKTESDWSPNFLSLP